MLNALFGNISYRVVIFFFHILFSDVSFVFQERFEDIQGVIGNRKSKDRTQLSRENEKQ
jgi:hypothetical protein